MPCLVGRVGRTRWSQPAAGRRTSPALGEVPGQQQRRPSAGHCFGRGGACLLCQDLHPGWQCEQLGSAKCPGETLQSMPSFKSASSFDYAYPFSKRNQVFGSGPRLHRSGIKIVQGSLFVSGLQVLIIFSIFPTLSFIPATAYLWFMLLASSSF